MTFLITFIKRVLLMLIGLAFIAWLVLWLGLHFEQHAYTPVSEDVRKQAIAYQQGKLTEPPDNWQWQQFEPEPGIVLRTGLVDAKNARGTVIVVPGFTGTIELSMDAIVQFNEAGFRVAAIEYRGQGKSHRPLAHPEKGYVKDYALLAQDMASFARHVKRRNEPLYFFAISKGGHITVRMAAEYDVDVSAFALVVPMIKINSGSYDYAGVKRMATVLDAVGLGAMYAPGQSQWPPTPLIFGEANGCNANPETAQLQSATFALDETLRTRGTTIKWLKETTRSTEIITSPGYIDALTQPVLVFTAGDDRLVDTEAINAFCGQLHDCKIEHFPYARHCINREDPMRMREIVRQSIDHFEHSSNVNSQVD